ncbi:MAG: hypothetical protein IJD77_00965 [Clostridia bacterium]|nr:hypothetical protein [Clostridia bacterium]
MRVEASQLNRKYYALNDFRGVDYSSSPLEVKPYRATDMQNLILKDGVLHKRNGWKRMLKVSSNKIDGVWQWKDSLIVQCGRMFYKIASDESVTTIGEFNATQKAVVFHSQDKMYFLTGAAYLMYDGETVVNLVNNREKAYIPTTMSVSASGVRTAKESANLISAWRKFEFQLDGTFEDYGAYDIIFDKQVKVDDVGEDQFSGYSKYAPKIAVYTQSTEGRFSFKFNEEKKQWEESLGFGIIINNHGLHLSKELSSGFYKARWVVEYFPKIGEVSIENEEASTLVPDTTTNISTGKVGAIFGADGAADRLFVGGNDLTPNIVYYSANTLENLPDFSYFPANCFVRCGQAINGITALSRVSDGTLAVFKDATAVQEPTVYFVTGASRVIETDDAGVSAFEDVFQVKSGNMEERGITSSGIATLAGDSLFVSKTGVYGLTLSDNVASAERYARPRSKVINAKLTKYDLSNARAIAFDNRYYLAVGGENNEVYVADSRYKYNVEGDENNSFNYEWFRWTNIPANEWFIYKNELWFGTADGWLCKFTNEYADNVFSTVIGDGLTVEINNDDGTHSVYFNEELLSIVKTAKYVIHESQKLEILNIHKDDKGYRFDVSDKTWNPDDVTSLNLEFYNSIDSYWKSAVLDLGSSIYRKNLWSLSASVMPTDKGRVNIGYKTRSKETQNISVQGANAFSFDDMDFSFFSFDCGGFVNAYRQRCFERGFVYLQLMFASDSIGDCVVNEISVEYAPTRKNIGVN